MTQKNGNSKPQPRLLTLPTSFAESFISDLSELNNRFTESGKVFELYGSFQHGSFHSARPATFLRINMLERA